MSLKTRLKLISIDIRIRIYMVVGDVLTSVLRRVSDRLRTLTVQRGIVERFK